MKIPEQLLEIEGKNYAFRSTGFTLGGKSYIAKDVIKEIEKHTHVIQDLLAIEGQTILVEVQPKEEEPKTPKQKK